jgi:hypothetical protein
MKSGVSRSERDIMDDGLNVIVDAIEQGSDRNKTMSVGSGLLGSRSARISTSVSQNRTLSRSARNSLVRRSTDLRQLG